MWKMGYNDGADLCMADSFNNGKFRSMIPKTISSATLSGGGSSSGSGRNGPGIISSPCLIGLHGRATDVFSPNPNHIGMMSEQSKRESSPQQQVVVCSRWNPTREQLRTLEELYERGIRTPTADQIQHITVQLQQYGNIEGKNVFYWFQNHKARERQKRRREMESNDQLNLYDCIKREIKTLGKKEAAEGAASTKKVLGVDQPHHHRANKNGINSHNLASPRMKCTALEEENATSAIQKTVVKAGKGLERKPSSLERHHQWMNMIEHNGESQCRLKNVNDTWAMMQHHQVSAYPPSTRFINTPAMDPKYSNNKYSDHHHRASFLKGLPPLCPAPLYCSVGSPQQEIFMNSHPLDISHRGEVDVAEENEFESSQTLELFPLRSGDGNGYTNDKETEMSASTINSFVAHPHQFFEFLPLKK
ncbi:hypothetical protein SAY87_021358 [Trapa incisa]|uniref:Homeobox domain-containing protein n=1 Tax=Trapa incisa TaxID=236973 RepID=A0AAN7JTD9_9MYRT|nr:hypothetical protein SAY87_021358 [Trapa incisa]